MMPELVVLISGRGSNLKAIADNIKYGRLNAKVSAVISNKPGAKGLEYAALVSAKPHVLDDSEYPSSQEYDLALSKIIDKYTPDLLILAGFMRILTKDFVKRFNNRILNIHPSLLPKHKGLNTHQRVLAAGDRVHGATVHFVTDELDTGPIIMQAEVPVLENDDTATLAARVLKQEHILYSRAIQKVLLQG